MLGTGEPCSRGEEQWFVGWVGGGGVHGTTAVRNIHFRYILCSFILSVIDSIDAIADTAASSVFSTHRYSPGR